MLAILLTAGWSALANLACGDEESATSVQYLREAMARVPEEITQIVETINSLVDLARPLLLSDWLLQPLPVCFAQLPLRLQPNLGPLQEKQARLDALQQALSAYQTAALRYTKALSELFETALSEYQQELATGIRPKPTSRTADELHERWIQIAERTYERFLSSGEYTQVIGQLVNAWADLQLAARPIMDEVLLYIGSPSRRDVDDIQIRLDRLRRQQRADITRLQREITALRAELASWRDDSPGSPLGPRGEKSNHS